MENREKKKVTIAIPLSWTHCYSPFMLSLLQMCLYSADKFKIAVYTSNTSLIDKMREVLAEEVQTTDPDYILWLDADQLYPMETIAKLAKHIDEGHLVVGGVTPDKHTAKPMVYRFLTPEGSCAQDRGFKVSRGLVQVDAMGFGGIMMAADVLKKIEPPYFPRTRDEAMQSFVGEDFGFYNNCRKAGIDVWCDTDLHYSHMVGTAVNVNRKPTCDSWESLEAFGEKQKIVKEKDVFPA